MFSLLYLIIRFLFQGCCFLESKQKESNTNVKRNKRPKTTNSSVFFFVLFFSRHNSRSPLIFLLGPTWLHTQQTTSPLFADSWLNVEHVFVCFINCAIGFAEGLHEEVVCRLTTAKYLWSTTKQEIPILLNNVLTVRLFGRLVLWKCLNNQYLTCCGYLFGQTQVVDKSLNLTV